MGGVCDLVRETGRRGDRPLQNDIGHVLQVPRQLQRDAVVETGDVDPRLELRHPLGSQLRRARRAFQNRSRVALDIPVDQQAGELLATITEIAQRLVSRLPVRGTHLHFAEEVAGITPLENPVRGCTLREYEELRRIALRAALIEAHHTGDKQPIVHPDPLLLDVEAEVLDLALILANVDLSRCIGLVLAGRQVSPDDAVGSNVAKLVSEADG